MKKILFLIMLACILASQPLLATMPECFIDTMVGGGDATSADPLLSLNLFSPQGIVLDSLGNLYIAEQVAKKITVIGFGSTPDAIGRIPTISTYAGTGGEGFFGDGRPALDAEFISPGYMALDTPNTTLYIADRYNDRIRKINLSTGIITTYAGNGTYADDPLPPSGDGGAATEVQISHPGGIVIDAFGNFFIAESAANRIRKVSPAGIISTFFESSAYRLPIMLTPNGLALDSVGNLYVVAGSSSQILKINPAGTATVVAGTGIQGFSGDSGLATLASLNVPTGLSITHNWITDHDILYFSDNGNNRIRKIDLTTNIITTVAGNGTAGFSGDGGRPTDAQLNHPTSVLAMSDGFFWFSDSGNNRIRKVSECRSSSASPSPAPAASPPASSPPPPPPASSAPPSSKSPPSAPAAVPSAPAKKSSPVPASKPVPAPATPRPKFGR